MAKPRLIILIRHAQSEGNKNREIHQTIPDHRVKLTQDGWSQAHDAGRRLRAMLRADDTLQFFTSPYRRTRETTEGILETLTSDETEPSPFKRNNIKVYEEPRLREQDFGNFQPCSAEMERMWQERADYGHFFYRIPNGESAADAYDRISGFNESLWRQFGEDDFASVCVLVTHGLMSRVFLMKWYHFSVEYFEDLRNVNHCEFLIMRKQEESGKYLLENKLRTWSDLRRERAHHQKQKEHEANGNAKDNSKLEKAVAVASPVAPRRWGGCPHGCNHDKNFKIRSGLMDLIKRDGTAIYDQPAGAKDASKTTAGATNGHPGLGVRRPAARRFQSSGTARQSDGDDCDDDGDDDDATPLAPQIDITRAREEIVSSPDATPSFITPDARLRSSPGALPRYLHVGRDFGGTYSGHTSDADSSEDERTRHRLGRLRISGGGVHPASMLGGGGGTNGSAEGLAEGAAAKAGRRRLMANRLGDAPHCSDCENENDAESSDGPRENTPPPEADSDAVLVEREDDLAEAERQDRSIQGSVY